MKNKLTYIFLLLFALSCNNNPIKPSDYTKEEIDKKYPYWQVGIERFYIAPEISDYTVITVEEKRWALRSLALMRAIINTPEFETEFMKKTYTSSRTVTNGGFPINFGEAYDNNRLLTVIRNRKYNVQYCKYNSKNQVAVGGVGPSRYALEGFVDNLGDATFVGIPNMNWKSEFAYGIFVGFMGVIFHEHLHNTGLTHIGGHDATTAVQTVAEGIGKRILGGDLKDKYQKQVEELTAYYYTEYKEWLVVSTTYNP